MHLRTLSLVLMAAALAPSTLLAKAEALPDPLPITEPRNAAAGYAITRDISMYVLQQRCAALGGELEGRFARAYGDWQRANRPAVDAAYFWTQFVGTMLSSEAGEDAGRRFVADTSRALETQGRQTVDILFDGHDVDVANCEKLLPLYEHPEFAADAHPEFKPLLAEMADMHERLKRATASDEGR